ncbi:hypothetical protein KL943_000367 [Ogataea angusta]|nr:hypothetical protein KL943_000367 [Ogataea angusta]
MSTATLTLKGAPPAERTEVHLHNADRFLVLSVPLDEIVKPIPLFASHDGCPTVQRPREDTADTRPLPSVLQNAVTQRIVPNVSSFGLQYEENGVLPNKWLESIVRDEQRAT